MSRCHKQQRANLEARREYLLALAPPDLPVVSTVGRFAAPNGSSAAVNTSGIIDRRVDDPDPF